MEGFAYMLMALGGATLLFLVGYVAYSCAVIRTKEWYNKLVDDLNEQNRRIFHNQKELATELWWVKAELEKRQTARKHGTVSPLRSVPSKTEETP